MQNSPPSLNLTIDQVNTILSSLSMARGISRYVEAVGW